MREYEMWLETLSMVQTAAEAGITVWESSGRIRKFASRTKFRATHGKLSVPIFGAGGAGKSTLGKFLGGKLDLAHAPEAYDESIGTQRFSFPGLIVADFYVPPGQERRSSEHWPPMLRKIISSKRVQVIINVVAYGYHSFSLFELKEHRLFQLGDGTDNFLNRYLEDRRQAELKMLDTIAHAIALCGKPIRMMTVVTKQDLWWDQRKAVREYYERGAYAETLNSIEKSSGTLNFRHEFVPVSLVLSNLVTMDNTVLKRICEGYDHRIHITSLAGLVRSFTEMAR